MRPPHCEHLAVLPANSSLTAYAFPHAGHLISIGMFHSRSARACRQIWEAAKPRGWQGPWGHVGAEPSLTPNPPFVLASGTNPTHHRDNLSPPSVSIPVSDFFAPTPRSLSRRAQDNDTDIQRLGEQGEYGRAASGQDVDRNAFTEGEAVDRSDGGGHRLMAWPVASACSGHGSGMGAAAPCGPQGELGKSSAATAAHRYRAA